MMVLLFIEKISSKIIIEHRVIWTDRSHDVQFIEIITKADESI